MQLFFLLILIILASFAEVVSLGAVVPFLGVLTDPKRVVTGSLALALPIETKNRKAICFWCKNFLFLSETTAISC